MAMLWISWIMAFQGFWGGRGKLWIIYFCVRFYEQITGDPSEFAESRKAKHMENTKVIYISSLQSFLFYV